METGHRTTTGPPAVEPGPRPSPASGRAGARLRRLAAVAAVETHGAGRHLGACALLVLGLALPAREVDGALLLWGVVVEGYGALAGGPLPAFLRECLSWWWLIAAVGYVLPVLLLPLAASFAPSQVLWLRLTPCSPRDVALARTARLGIAVASLGALGLPAAVACARWHGVPVAAVLDVAAGLLAHALLAGGVVLIAGPALYAPAGRALAAFVGFLMPLFLFLAYAALGARLPAGLRSWWPYAVPFVPAWGEPAGHVLVAAGLGAALVVLAVLRQPGRCESPFVPPEESAS